MNLRELSVTLIEAKQLDSSGFGVNKEDIFSHANIWIGRKKMKEETSKKNGENPYFGEIFTFNCIPIDDKDYNMMLIEFFHNGKGDLGYTTINLAQLGLNKTYVGWFKLKGNKINSGEVRIQVKLTKDLSPKAAEVLKSQIKNECKKTGQKYCDPDFPADLSSIFIDKNKPEVEISRQITCWKRPTEIFENPRFFVNGVESGDVIQGNLGDCWFLGAVSILATREDLLLPLFVSKEEEFGFYQFKFYKNGEWKVVTIDDRLPSNGRKVKPFVYAHSQTDNEVWVPLIEKAYAKLHGSFQALEMGTIAQALTDLTGESAQEFLFKEKEVSDRIQKGLLWKDLIQWLEIDKYLVGCSFQDDKGREEDMGMGIMSGHAYSILEAHEVNSKGTRVKLLKIRNPWGSYEWKGRWSDNSSEWTNELRKELHLTEGNDGVFWIQWEDFIVQYNNIMLCRLLTDDVGEVWSKYEFKGNMVGKNSGGACSNETTWLYNDQYILDVDHETPIFITVMQKDLRLEGIVKYQTAIGMEIQKTDDKHLPLLSAPHSSSVFSSTFNKGRETSKYLFLDSGKYVLVPSTFIPGQETTYILTAYSLKSIHFKRIFYDDYTVSGSWTSQHGGCVYNPNWLDNPQYLLNVPTNAKDLHIKIALRQNTTDPVAGVVYLLKRYQKGSKIIKEQIHKPLNPTAARVNEQHFSLGLNEGPFLLVATTNKPGETGNFEITVFSKLGELYKLQRIN